MFFDSKGQLLPLTGPKNAHRTPGSKPLSHVIKCSDPLFVDFIQQCLTWEPEKRITPEAALQHKWVTKACGSPSRELAANGPELNRTQIMTYYATHNKGIAKVGVDKSILNKTLTGPMQIQGLSIKNNSQPSLSPKSDEETKLQEKLLKLKERLKLMTTKQTTVTMKYNTGGIKNTESPRINRGILLHVLSKKTTVDNTPKAKQSLKQSNLF